MAVVLSRDARVGRAIPVDTAYRVTEVEVLPVLKIVKPVRRLRAIHMSDQARHDIALAGLMLPFIVLLTLDFALVPLWAAFPGAAVITASMIVSVIAFAGHSDAPSTRSHSSKYSRHSRR